MSNMNKVIGEISELNNKSNVTESDLLTIEKVGGVLYIKPRFHLWRGTIFMLDDIAKILIKNGQSFYLSSTRYDSPAVVVPIG